jgi:hypothetical protein
LPEHLHGHSEGKLEFKRADVKSLVLLS